VRPTDVLLADPSIGRAAADPFRRGVAALTGYRPRYQPGADAVRDGLLPATETASVLGLHVTRPNLRRGRSK